MFTSQCNEEENVIHTLLKCFETQRWREKFSNDKCLDVNGETTRKRAISC
jgi:hypothetical protein